MVLAEYEGYTRNALVQLRRVREGTTIAEDHMRNRQMIVRWLMANTKAIEQRTRDGKTYLTMVDAKAFREGVGRLLAEVQRIKSEGDYAGAAKLFDTYGVHFDPKGLYGERAFDYANIFCNPDRATATAPGRLARRKDTVSEAAHLDRGRLLKWVIAYAALSAAWCVEDREDPMLPLAIVQIASREAG